MRLLILLLVAIAGVILAIQNQEPVMLVFFGSNAAFSFPLAGWILLFAAAGILTSFVVQFLIYLQRGTTTAKRGYRSVPPEPEPPKREVVETTNSSTSPLSDWEQPGTDDWGEEPRRSTLEEFKRRLPKEQAAETPEPRSASQSGSTYSYGYRPSQTEDNVKLEASEQTEVSPPEDNQSAQVYDANYRIITPPYRNEPPEDEDWV